MLFVLLYKDEFLKPRVVAISDWCVDIHFKVEPKSSLVWTLLTKGLTGYSFWKGKK